MGIRRKPTHDEKLLIAIYQELLKETGDTPSIAEVQERYKELYGNN